MEEKKRLLILDGNSLMNRAFYALPPLTNSEGLNTNAIYGFITMLIKMREEIKPNYIVCTFDKKAPTFRHKEYTDYKAGRKKMPDELAEQFPVVKEILSLMAIDIFEIEGFEADDLIGTLACFSEDKGIENYIVTGDRDALQLATDNTKVIITKKGITEKEIYDKNRMIEELGVTPTQFIDVKGLMGDASDNIPGVPGIGEKTAFKLIKEFGSVEEVLNNIDKISGKKIKENLQQYSEQAVFSKKLATIMTQVPIEIDLESIKSKESFDYNGLRNMFVRLQFKSLIDKIEVPENYKSQEEKVNITYDKIETISEFKVLEEELKKNNKEENLYIIYDIFNDGFVSRIKLNNLYVNFKDKNYHIDINKISSVNEEDVKYILDQLLSKNNLEVVTYDVKLLYEVLQKLGVEFDKLKFDVKLASYIIDPSRGNYDFDALISQYLMVELKKSEDKVKEVFYLKELYKLLEEKIAELNMERLLYEVEQPLAKVLSSMELMGFRVDRSKLEKLGIDFKNEIENMEKEIYALAEEEFNIGSPKQLGKILFEKLDLPVIKKTKTGYSTNAEVLEELMDKHPIIEKVVYYRQLTKIYSTYIEGLKAVIDEDEKIHSSFNQTVTTTGRLSSTEPNLQNIPIKYELGRQIRTVFVSENDESVILSADYSQIELRVLAHIADDENMIDGFKHHADIHTKTASEVFGVPIDKVTKLMRSNAKAVNFGIVYGISDFSLAKDLKIARKEAKSYIETYFERYPNIKKYLENIVKSAEELGFVTTILNRRRFIPELKGSNKIVKAFGERLAMNTPIQGSAADIIKMAMVNVYNKLQENNMKSKLILQVHDELILNVYKDELEKVKELVKNEMENVTKLKVPLEIDMNVGETWYDAK